MRPSLEPAAHLAPRDHRDRSDDRGEHAGSYDGHCLRTSETSGKQCCRGHDYGDASEGREENCHGTPTMPRRDRCSNDQDSNGEQDDQHPPHGDDDIVRCCSLAISRRWHDRRARTIGSPRNVQRATCNVQRHSCPDCNDHRGQGPGPQRPVAQPVVHDWHRMGHPRSSERIACFRQRRT